MKTEIISWISLGVALLALYYSVRKDKQQMKIETIRQRGELRKRISFLELDVIPRFKTFYEQAESKCKSCASFHKDDYDLIGWHLGELKIWTDKLNTEIKKPISKQDIAHIEECISLINWQEQMLEHFEKIFEGRINCTKKK